MDSREVGVLPERLKVVELGRRRRWSEDEKPRTVIEGLVEPGRFRGRRGDLIRCLGHDGLGLSLHAERLDRGRFA